MTDDACRVDVWLWRARLFKTRALAGAFAASGRIRLTRAGVETRLDKASRLVRPGDQILFARAGRLVVVTVERIGERRGPAAEARGLYSSPTPSNICDLDGEGGEALDVQER